MAYEMRISDWSSDVCSSDLEQVAQLQELVRRLRATAHLSAHAVEPADQLQVEVGVAAEVVVHPRAAFEQAGQDLVDVLDRVGVVHAVAVDGALRRSEEHTSDLQSLMRISYAVFCLKKK